MSFNIDLSKIKATFPLITFVLKQRDLLNILQIIIRHLEETQVKKGIMNNTAIAMTHVFLFTLSVSWLN